MQAPDEVRCSLLGAGAQSGLCQPRWSLGSVRRCSACLALQTLHASPTATEQHLSLCPTDLRFTGAEQDIRSTLELATGLPVELDACVASTVRALQDDMRRVLERLSELETLASAQVHAVPCCVGRHRTPPGRAMMAAPA